METWYQLHIIEPTLIESILFQTTYSTVWVQRLLIRITYIVSTETLSSFHFFHILFWLSLLKVELGIMKEQYFNLIDRTIVRNLQSANLMPE